MEAVRSKQIRLPLLTVLVVLALVFGALPTIAYAAANTAEVSTTVTPTSPTGLGDVGGSNQSISSSTQMTLVFPNPLPSGGNYVLLGATVEIRASSSSSSSNLNLRLANSSSGSPLSGTVSFGSSWTNRTITADSDENGAVLSYLQSLISGDTISINLLASRSGSIDRVALTLYYEPITGGPQIEGECTAADIHLVVDNSISIGSNINTYKNNIKSFMADVEAGMPGTNWRVTWFGTDPNQTGTVTSDWVANPADLTAFIDQVRTQGYTPTANGINAAVSGGSTPTTPLLDNDNDVMIVLTDGAPNVVLNGPAGFNYNEGGAAAIEQAEAARAAGWSTLVVMIGTGDTNIEDEWAANVNRGIAGADVTGPSGDVLPVSDFGTLAPALINLLAPGCERTIIVGKMVDPTGGVADGSTFSGKIDAGTQAEKIWSGVGFGQFSAPIKVIADQFHVVTEDDPAGVWSLKGWAMGGFDQNGAPICPTDPTVYSGTSIDVPASAANQFAPAVVCVMNTRPAVPAIDVEKFVSVDGQATWDDADTATGPTVGVGADVYFKFVVTNTGNVPLAGLSLSDSVFDLSGCTVTDPLAPGASFECYYGPVAAVAGQHSNTATAGGTSPSQQPVSDTDPAHYFGAALSVSKTATTTYTRTYTWTIEKGSDADYDMFAGDPAISHSYSVAVDRTVTDSDWAVSGNITINNPTAATATITGVTDVVSPDINATVDCGVTFPYDLAGGGTLICSYSAALPDATSRTNTATVTTTGAVIGGNGTADVTFGDPTSIVGSASVNVTDSNGQSWTAGDDANWNYAQNFSCPTDPSAYTNGVYAADDYVNTATITETGQSDTATVGLTCYAPVVGKTADGTFTRTHTWDVEKTVNPTSQTGSPEDVLSWMWTITVSESYVDSDFRVSGQVTVVNPNPNSEIIVSLIDTVSDGTGVTLNCTGATPLAGEGEYSIPAGGTAVCSYDAAVTGQATTNTAVASINGVNFSGSAAIGWTPTVVNGTATLVDTQIGLSETLTAGEGPWTRTGNDSHTCAVESSGVYTSTGSYGDTVSNTATVTGSDGQTDSSETDTTYTCSVLPIPGIDVEKSTNGEDADTPTGPEIPVGATVTWTYEVTNTGNVDLTNVTVTDDQGVVVSCPQDTLAVGESMTCTATGTATAGQYVNTGTAEGYFEQTPVNDSDLSHYFGVQGSLTVTKQVEWNRAAADPTMSFEICVSGPSFDQPNCVMLKDGESYTWTDLIAGEYTVSESPIVGDTLQWTVEVVYEGAADSATVVAGETAQVTVLNVTDYEAPPTAVDLAKWDTNSGTSGVQHTWQTVMEKDVNGFRLYRGSNATFGEAELVGEVAAKGASTYQWVDSGVEAGTWYYWLVEVNGDGEEIEVFGPKSVTAGVGGQRSDTQRIYLPLTLSLR